MVLALVLKVLTALALMVMILAQYYLISLMDSEVIYNFEKKHSLTDSLTHLVNNIGLRDASASKKAASDSVTRVDRSPGILHCTVQESEIENCCMKSS